MKAGARSPLPLRELHVILDADAITKVARRDRRVRLMLERLTTERQAVLVVPLVGVIQALAEGTSEGAVERVLRATLSLSGLDVARARVAAHLLRDAGTRDVADALICGEALMRVPCVLITSDPGDMRRLLDADPRGPRVAVWAI